MGNSKLLKINKAEIELNKLVEFELKSELVPLTISQAEKLFLMIDEHIQTSYEIKEITDYLSTGPSSVQYRLITTVDWVWKNHKGALTKRIQKHMYEEYKIKLSDRFVSAIGNYISSIMPKPTKYYFDITDQVEWTAGTFGDHASCFFDSNNHGRPNSAVTELLWRGGLALRFFKPAPTSLKNEIPIYYNDFIGIGRAWLDPNSLVAPNAAVIHDAWHGSTLSKVYEKTTTIFNGYGLRTYLIAKIMEAFTKTITEEVTHYTRKGSVYVNGDVHPLCKRKYPSKLFVSLFPS